MLTVSKGAADSATLMPVRRHGVEQPGAVEVHRRGRAGRRTRARPGCGRSAGPRRRSGCASARGTRARRRPVHVGVRVAGYSSIFSRSSVPSRRVEHAQLHLAERRRGALLVEQDVRLACRNTSSPRRVSARTADLVAHRAGRQVQRGFLAERARRHRSCRAHARSGRRRARRRRPRPRASPRPSGDGRVTVSLRRSTVFMVTPWRDAGCGVSLSHRARRGRWGVRHAADVRSRRHRVRPAAA